MFLRDLAQLRQHCLTKSEKLSILVCSASDGCQISINDSHTCECKEVKAHAVGRWIWILGHWRRSFQETVGSVDETHRGCANPLVSLTSDNTESGCRVQAGRPSRCGENRSGLLT